MSAVVTAAPGRSRFRGLLRTLSDERLVARVRAGDQAAFEVVYDRYQRDLLSFCRHMLGTAEGAEDALQHTYISAYRALLADDRPIQLKAWLFAIARNRCLSMLRARREHTDIEEVQVSVEGLTSEVQQRADLQELLADLQRLPDDQRAALLLTEMGAHSHEEVAVILDVRKEKIKALVFQAREQLIGARAARETDCRVIREQLATLRGGALRRTELRRHLDSCPGCRAYKLEVQRQRAAIAVMLPVAPGTALKASILGTLFGGGAAGGGGGGGGATIAGGAAAAGGVAAVGAAAGGGGLFASLGAQGFAIQALVTLSVAGGAGGTGYLATQQLSKGPQVPEAEVRAAATSRSAALQLAAAAPPMTASPVTRQARVVLTPPPAPIGGRFVRAMRTRNVRGGAVAPSIGGIQTLSATPGAPGGPGAGGPGPIVFASLPLVETPVHVPPAADTRDEDEDKAEKEARKEQEKAAKDRRKEQSAEQQHASVPASYRPSGDDDDDDREKADRKAQKKLEKARKKAAKDQQKRGTAEQARPAPQSAAPASPKAEEKARKRQEKADRKAAKQQQKADRKAAKRQEKADRKAAKQQEKADKKARKEQEKADKKAADERERSWDKARKDQEKADKKARKEQEKAEKD